MPPGTDDAHVIKGATLADLEPRRSASGWRATQHVTGGLQLAPDFEKTLRGDDSALQRLCRERAGISTSIAASVRSSCCSTARWRRRRRRRTRRCFRSSEQGPYYAALLTGGNLDTKGGPKTNVAGQVLDDQDKPIAGPLRRRQLRRLGLGPRLLGRRRDDRSDPGVRLSGGRTPRTRNARSSPDRSSNETRRRWMQYRFREEIDGSSKTDDDGRAAEVGRDRISQGLRPGGERPGTAAASWICSPTTRRSISRNGALPTARRRSGRCSATSAARSSRSQHHFSHFNLIFSGSDLVVCEGTSEGEHRDGPWRAGAPEHGGRAAGATCSRFATGRFSGASSISIPTMPERTPRGIRG